MVAIFVEGHERTLFSSAESAVTKCAEAETRERNVAVKCDITKRYDVTEKMRLTTQCDVYRPKCDRPCKCPRDLLVTNATNVRAGQEVSDIRPSAEPEG